MNLLSSEACGETERLYHLDPGLELPPNLLDLADCQALRFEVGNKTQDLCHFAHCCSFRQTAAKGLRGFEF